MYKLPIDDRSLLSGLRMVPTVVTQGMRVTYRSLFIRDTVVDPRVRAHCRASSGPFVMLRARAPGTRRSCQSLCHIKSTLLLIECDARDQHAGRRPICPHMFSQTPAPGTRHIQDRETQLRSLYNGHFDKLVGVFATFALWVKCHKLTRRLPHNDAMTPFALWPKS